MGQGWCVSGEGGGAGRELIQFVRLNYQPSLCAQKCAPKVDATFLSILRAKHQERDTHIQMSGTSIVVVCRARVCHTSAAWQGPAARPKLLQSCSRDGPELVQIMRAAHCCGGPIRDWPSDALSSAQRRTKVVTKCRQSGQLRQNRTQTRKRKQRTTRKQSANLHHSRWTTAHFRWACVSACLFVCVFVCVSGAQVREWETWRRRRASGQRREFYGRACES